MNITRHIYAISTIMAVLTAASFGTAHYKAMPPAGSNVTVTNTTAQPVPTVAQGTTQVAGTVGLANGASVSVNNAAANPIPVYDVNGIGTKTPVNAQVNFSESSGTGTFATLYTVPAGKILVIETESVSAQLPSGQVLIDAEFDTTIANQAVGLSFTQHTDNGLHSWASGQSTGPIYVKAGDTVRGFCGRSIPGGTAQYSMSFEGYLANSL